MFLSVSNQQHSHFEAITVTSGSSAKVAWKRELTLLTLQIVNKRIKFTFQETGTKLH